MPEHEPFLLHNYALKVIPTLKVKVKVKLPLSLTEYHAMKTYPVLN
jgi:hypothetical protein